MTSRELWVKCRDSTDDAFLVEIGDDAIIDDLKDAITTTTGEEVQFIYATKQGDDRKNMPDALIPPIDSPKVGLTADLPYYYTTLQSAAQQPGTTAVVQEIPVREARKRRWDGLNTVLDINKRAKRVREDELSSFLAEVKEEDQLTWEEFGNTDWDDVKHICINKWGLEPFRITKVETIWHNHPANRKAFQTDTTAIVQRIPVHEARKRRWDGLNFVLDINKKGKLCSDGYSYANWEQVKKYFPVVLGNLGTASGDGLPLPLLHALHQYLSCASICFGSIISTAKRIHFIAPIITIVCSFFQGNIQILAEEDVEGNRVHAHSHFEFVLKREDKRICIVEAKKDDLLQAKTSSLIGCESLCDVDDLPVTYGIATNYLEWIFLKNEADKITEEMMTVSLEDSESGRRRPTVESLKQIANKIIAILE